MKKKSPEPLETPLEPLRVGAFSSDEYMQKVAAQRAEALDEKLRMLVPVYGIRPGPHQWYHLALALAAQVHAGFREAPRIGRGRSWDDFTRALLVVEVERTMRAEKCSASRATQVLSVREPWKSFLKPRELNREGRFITPDPAAALRKVYQKFKRTKFAAVGRDAFRYHEEIGTTQEWTARVREALKK